MSQPYIGEIRMFGGNFAPAGWAFCNGALFPISENTALFSLIGATYGGDGQITFALPDLQSRVPIHQGNGFSLGQRGGEESVTLTTAQMPGHTHIHRANANTGDATSPQGAVMAESKAGLPLYGPAPGIAMNSGAIANTGGSQPHTNMMPYLTVSFIISLFGIYPSQG